MKFFLSKEMNLEKKNCKDLGVVRRKKKTSKTVKGLHFK